MEPLTVIGIIALLVLIVILGKYNGLVRTKKKVEQEWATIDVYLTQRFDLIPNLVECVKSIYKAWKWNIWKNCKNENRIYEHKRFRKRWKAK